MAITGYGAFAEEVKTEARRMLPIPAGHGLRDRRGVRAHLRDVGARAGRPRRAEGRRDAAGARRRRRRRPRGDRDRQGARRARHRLRVDRRQARRLPRSTAPTTTINYATEDLRERIKALTGGNGADVVYDPVGGPYTEPALRSIAWRGRLLVVGFAAGEIPKIPLNLTLLKGCSIVGVFWGDFARREPQQFAEPRCSSWHDWYAEGKLKPHVSETFPLERAADALALMAARKVKGKVVL